MHHIELHCITLYYIVQGVEKNYDFLRVIPADPQGKRQPETQSHFCIHPVYIVLHRITFYNIVLHRIKLYYIILHCIKFY